MLFDILQVYGAAVVTGGAVMVVLGVLHARRRAEETRTEAADWQTRTRFGTRSTGA